MIIDKLREFLFGDAGPEGGRGIPATFDERHFASVALMIEAASLGESFEPVERARIVDLARRHFGLTPADAGSLVAAAERRMADTHQILPFTRIVKDRFSEAERVELVEMLWEVIYADGAVHDYEAGLMRRLGGLIYVGDVDIGAARKRVLARLGLDGDDA